MLMLIIMLMLTVMVLVKMMKPGPDVLGLVRKTLTGLSMKKICVHHQNDVKISHLHIVEIRNENMKITKIPKKCHRVCLQMMVGGASTTRCQI